MATDSIDPIAALESLGLPSYEAKVFVALQKLGSGTAKEVGEVADVPRSQVYGTAERLEERGLIEIQDATPKIYRPVSLAEARRRLEERFESNTERAFTYLEGVQGDQSGTAEEQEGVWRLVGSAAIEGRACQLIERGTDRVVYGRNNDVAFTGRVKTRLAARASEGIPVVVLTDDPDESYDIDGVRTHVIPSNLRGSEHAGRLLLVDSDTVLMSAVSPDGSETAIWSAGTGFARVLVPLVEDATLRT